MNVHTPVCFHHIFLHISAGGGGVRSEGQGLSLCDLTNLQPAPFRNFSCGGSRLSDARCSTPVPGRKRRCTTSVDYKEPSLIAYVHTWSLFSFMYFFFLLPRPQMLNNCIPLPPTVNFAVATSSQMCSFSTLLFSSRSLIGGLCGNLGSASSHLRNTMSLLLDVAKSCFVVICWMLISACIYLSVVSLGI